MAKWMTQTRRSKGIYGLQAAVILNTNIQFEILSRKVVSGISLEEKKRGKRRKNEKEEKKQTKKH